MNFKKHLFLFAGILSCSFIMAQQPSDILSVSASTKLEKASLAFDKDPKTMGSEWSGSEGGPVADVYHTDSW